MNNVVGCTALMEEVICDHGAEGVGKDGHRASVSEEVWVVLDEELVLTVDGSMEPT